MFYLSSPVEYCGSLCSPSVSKSPYLQTVGEELLPNITVIWTGGKKTQIVSCFVMCRQLRAHTCTSENKRIILF